MWKPAETNYKEIIEKKISNNQFMHFLGFKITNIEAGLVEGELDLVKHHMQQADFLHGGVTSTVADIVAGFAAFTLVKHTQNLVTVDLHVSYLNPGLGNKLFAKGFVIKAGQKLFFSEAEIWMENNSKKIMIAKASGTFAVINPEDIRK
jgi:uncharacterized protein (TIGR00369 family)